MGDRSIHVGGNVNQSTLVTGDGNEVSNSATAVRLPDPGTVDVAAALSGLQAALSALQGERQGAIERALSDAAEEVTQAEPDKREIGARVGRALELASKMAGFASQVASLTPHLQALCAWLGPQSYDLLTHVGMKVLGG